MADRSVENNLLMDLTNWIDYQYICQKKNMELKLTGFHPEAGAPIGQLRNIVFPCVGEYVTRNGFDSVNRPTLCYYIDINGERYGAMWFVTDNAYINKLIDRLWADYKQSL